MLQLLVQNFQMSQIFKLYAFGNFGYYTVGGTVAQADELELMSSIT